MKPTTSAQFTQTDLRRAFVAGRMSADNPDIEAAFQKMLREMTADSTTPPPTYRIAIEKPRLLLDDLKNVLRLIELNDLHKAKQALGEIAVDVSFLYEGNDPPPQPNTSFSKERVFITYARLVEVCFAFYRDPSKVIAELVNRSEWR